MLELDGEADNDLKKKLSERSVDVDRVAYPIRTILRRQRLEAEKKRLEAEEKRSEAERKRSEAEKRRLERESRWKTSDGTF